MLQKKYIDKIQIVLFTIFLFLWFISANITILRIISICIFGAFCIIQLLQILQDKNVYINKGIISFGLFSIFGYISMLWATNKGDATSKALELFMGFVILMITYNFFMRKENGVDLIISIIKSVGTLFAIYIVLYYGVPNYFNMLLSGKRIGTEIINVNFIGVVSSINFILLIYDLLYKQQKNKLLVCLFSIISLIVALGTGSKKAIIVIALGLVLLLLKKIREKFTIKKVITLLFFVVFMVVGIYSLANSGALDTVFHRFETMANTLFDDNVTTGSTYIRKSFISGGMKAFYGNPILGIGLNNSNIITDDLINQKTYLHCNYVELLACTGIIGFILYYYIFYYVLSYCVKNLNEPNADIILIIFIVNLFLDIGNVSYYEIKTLLYLLLGLVFVGKLKKGSEKENGIKEKN